MQSQEQVARQPGATAANHRTARTHVRTLTVDPTAPLTPSSEPPETCPWLRQAKGIFAGAGKAEVTSTPEVRPARKPANRCATQSEKRIGGNARTVQEKKRKHRHQQRHHRDG